MRWVQRLIQERYSWKYCVFYTLTYDNEHLPLLKFVNGFISQLETNYQGDDVKFINNSGFLYDVHHRLTPPVHDVVSIDISECIYKHSKDHHRDVDWLTRVSSAFGGVPVLSSYDLSKFIKRLRTYSLREYEKRKREKSVYDENDKPFFRHFSIGEYGETLLRPHYHGLLFFNSEFLASNIGSILAKAWKHGICDCSFVANDNASYVASYLNCTAHLPSILRERFTRPFFLCSKFPPIGTLCHSSKEVREIFFSATPDQIIFDHKKGIFDNVPLWRTYQDKLFPRLSSFGTLSHSDRVTLYGLVSTKKFTGFPSFRQYVLFGVNRLTLIIDYVNYLKSNCDNFECALMRWYYISSRVHQQSLAFGVSIKDYVNQIEKFYENVEKRKLQLQYEWQQKAVDSNKQEVILGMDRLFLQSILDLDIANVSNEELIILSSYGVDVEKFFSDDETVRVEYQTSLLPDNTYDYQCLSIDSENWLSRNCKTKKKNEYLELHHEYKNFIY